MLESSRLAPVVADRLVADESNRRDGHEHTGRGARKPIVGVLALQGDFAWHEAALAAQGLVTRRVRRPVDLADLAGLVLPGGESTTMLRLLRIQGMTEPLAAACRSGLPVFASCAGMILLASRVEVARVGRDTVSSPDRSVQESLGVLPITVLRNGYGRQIASGTAPLIVEPGGASMFGDEAASGVFIRAPFVLAVEEPVEVLARRGQDPVLLRCGGILAACFHPEMQTDHPVTRWFANSVRAAAASSAPVSGTLLAEGD